jgi:hypothetical protein
MATVASGSLPHTSAFRVAPQETEVQSPKTAAAAAPPAVYRGDRWGVIFWMLCAALLVGLHVGQHVFYLLR